jgi:hypothetical protein
VQPNMLANTKMSIEAFFYFINDFGWAYILKYNLKFDNVNSGNDKSHISATKFT